MVALFEVSFCAFSWWKKRCSSVWCLSRMKALALVAVTCISVASSGSSHASTATYLPGSDGEASGLLPGMSIDQSNFEGGTFGASFTAYPAVNFDDYKPENAGFKLIFSLPEEPYRLDIPQEVEAYYGIKWTAPESQVFTALDVELLNEGIDEMPSEGSTLSVFQGCAYSVSNGEATLLGSWGKGGCFPGLEGSFTFSEEQNVTEIRVYALDARLGAMGIHQSFPNVYRAWSGYTLGIGSIRVTTAPAVAQPASPRKP